MFDLYIFSFILLALVMVAIEQRLETIPEQSESTQQLNHDHIYSTATTASDPPAERKSEAVPDQQSKPFLVLD